MARSQPRRPALSTLARGSSSLAWEAAREWGYNTRLERGEDKIVERRRILMIAPTSFFADYGCHVRILEEVRSLQKRGHVVQLCTYHNGRDLPDIDTRRTVDVPWRKRIVVGSSKHKMYLDVALTLTVLRQVRSFRPDVIHAHLHEGALIGVVAGRIFRVPVVFDYQGSLTEEMLDHGFLRRGGRRHRFFRWLERRIDDLPDAIVPSGWAAESFLLERGIDAGRIDVVPDAVDLPRFDPGDWREAGREYRRELGIPEHAPVVVYLGLLADYQGTPLLIEAAHELLSWRSEAYVVIAGYPGVGRHAALAGQSPHADRILLPGRIPYERAPALLALGNAAAAPKQSATEANGKILNYMAMGLPTVCIDTPLNHKLLGELGRYIAPGDARALARELDRALDDPPARHAALRERVAAHFSWDQQVTELERIYDRLARPRPHAQPERERASTESFASDD